MGEGSFYRERALKLGPDVERMIVILLAQGQGFIDTRKIWGILSLDKKYEKAAINRACRDAIALGEFGYRIVQSLLRLQAKAAAKYWFSAISRADFPARQDSKRDFRP